MALILIERDGVREEVDESLLVRTDVRQEEIHTRGGEVVKHYVITAVEYRFPDSDVIVHRSAHCDIKAAAGLAGVVQALGQ